MKYGIIVLVAFCMFRSAHGQDSSDREYNLLVGTYTEPGKSDGIYVYRFNSETGGPSYRAEATGIR